MSAKLGIAVTILLLCLTEALGSHFRVIGDGREYLAYTYNLARGHGPYFVELPPRIQEYAAPKLNRLQATSQSEALGTGRRVDEFIRTADGRIFSWHFWGYSAASMPAYLVLSKLGLDPAQAFTATNFLFVGSLLIYLVAGSRQSASFRSLFACLFLFSGTSFYLWWSHPEVMTASLSALGLIAWLDRRSIVSTACLALASTQNPPVALLIAFPGHLVFDNLRRSMREGSQLTPAIFEITGVLLFSLVTLIPGLWYTFHLGVSNPIISAGAAHFAWSNVNKSIDLFLDLNQGMVLLQVGSMVLLTGWFAWCISRPSLITTETRIRFHQAAFLIALTFAMSMMCASAQNWNPGITVISRYSYWLSIPVLLATCLAIEGITSSASRRRLESLLIFLGVALVGFFGVHGKSSNYVAFSAPSKLAMNYFPRWGFQHPEVFCERAQAKEDCDFNHTYVFLNSDRRILRLLVTEDYLLRFCGGPVREVPVRTERHDGKTLLWFTSDVTCWSGRSVSSSPER